MPPAYEDAPGEALHQHVAEHQHVASRYLGHFWPAVLASAPWPHAQAATMIVVDLSG